MIKVSVQYLLMISLLGLHSGQQLSYEEIESFGYACSPWNTCSIPRGPSDDNLKTNQCECKSSCTRYSTCCVDSPNNRPLVGKTKIDPQFSYHEDCHDIFGTWRYVFIKSKCKRDWDGDEETKLSCENDVRNYGDPISILPVTNPLTSTTYKNYFCSICNDDAKDSVLWTIRVSMRKPPSNSVFDENYVMQYLTYNNETDNWGFYKSGEQTGLVNLSESKMHDVADDATIFTVVNLNVEQPPQMDDKIHSCILGIVSDCHPDWTDEEVQQKCHSYMDVMYGFLNTSESPFTKFRNVHCAICNFSGTKSNLSCYRRRGGWGGHSSGGGGYGSGGNRYGGGLLSFAAIIDITPSDGGLVGQVKRCEGGELYDPFHKKCRRLVCRKSGYKVKNGTCRPA